MSTATRIEDPVPVYLVSVGCTLVKPHAHTPTPPPLSPREMALLAREAVLLHLLSIALRLPGYVLGFALDLVFLALKLVLLVFAITPGLLMLAPVLHALTARVLPPVGVLGGQFGLWTLHRMPDGPMTRSLHHGVIHAVHDGQQVRFGHLETDSMADLDSGQTVPLHGVVHFWTEPDWQCPAGCDGAPHWHWREQPIIPSTTSAEPPNEAAARLS